MHHLHYARLHLSAVVEQNIRFLSSKNGTLKYNNIYLEVASGGYSTLYSVLYLSRAHSHEGLTLSVQIDPKQTKTHHFIFLLIVSKQYSVHAKWGGQLEK